MIKTWNFSNSDWGEPLNVKDNLLFDEFESNLKYNGSRYEVQLSLMSGGNKKVTHTYTSLQLKAAGLFKYA